MRYNFGVAASVGRLLLPIPNTSSNAASAGAEADEDFEIGEAGCTRTVSPGSSRGKDLLDETVGSGGEADTCLTSDALVSDFLTTCWWFRDL